MGRILLLGVVLSLVTVAILPAMASATDPKFKAECGDDGCIVGVDCDSTGAELYVCVTWDPDTATKFVPAERDTTYGADVRTRVVIHEYEINTSAGSLTYPCGQVVVDYVVQTANNNVDGKERVPPCLGGHVQRRTYVEVDTKNLPTYVEAPDDIEPSDAIQLCDGQATVTVLGFGAKKVPIKSPC